MTHIGIASAIRTFGWGFIFLSAIMLAFGAVTGDWNSFHPFPNFVGIGIGVITLILFRKR